MKKVFSIFLCAVLVCLTLVGCGEDPVGDYLPNYDGYQKQDKPNLSLNLYIVVGEGTTTNAMTTVSQRIAQETEDDYKTKVNVFYVPEAEYAQTITAKVADEAENRADIVLINSKSLMDSLCAAGKLEDLTPLFATEQFGKLNVQIAPTLLSASNLGTPTNPTYMCVPNNHVVGEYRYIVINKAAAEHVYYSPADCADIKTEVDAIDLMTKLQAEGLYNDTNFKIVDGDYAKRFEFDANTYYCNVSKVPVVNADAAFSSAFAVVKGTADVSRAMEIIYEINNNTDLRDLLQYGVRGTNYLVNDETGDIEPQTTGDNVYNMNLKHTGNVFNASSSSAIGWTDQAKQYGALQNADSIKELNYGVYVAVSANVSNEIRANLSTAISEYTLQTYGTKLDLVFVTHDSEYLKNSKDAIRHGADILFIDSSATMSDLKSSIVEITDLLDKDKYSDIDDTIPTDVITASKQGNKSYIVPNTFAFNKCEFILIDKAAAAEVGYTEADCQSIVSMKSAAANDLIKKLKEKGLYSDDEENRDDSKFKLVTVKYDDISNYTEDYYCNFTFASGFGVVNGVEDVERAMDMIYALHTDAYINYMIQTFIVG